MSISYLILPDVHNRIDLAESIISKYESTHKIICLGDYFDSFGDNIGMAENTARWLKHSLNKGRTHLIGNHDNSYYFPFNNKMWCPGYSVEKKAAIRAILSQEDFQKLKLFYYIEKGNWLLSHAGFTYANLFGFKHPSYINSRYQDVLTLNKKDLLDIIYKQTLSFYNAALNNQYHHFMYQGSRMGEEGHGGPYWLHWDDFKPIPHLNQIIGHTWDKAPRFCYYPYHSNDKNAVSTNVCIDTNNKHFILIEDGKIKIEKCIENFSCVYGKEYENIPLGKVRKSLKKRFGFTKSEQSQFIRQLKINK